MFLLGKTVKEHPQQSVNKSKTCGGCEKLCAYSILVWHFPLEFFLCAIWNESPVVNTLGCSIESDRNDEMLKNKTPRKRQENWTCSASGWEDLGEITPSVCIWIWWVRPKAALLIIKEVSCELDSILCVCVRAHVCVIFNYWKHIWF